MTATATVSVRPLGGSTAIIELGGTRLITDPAFDPPAAPADGMPRRLAPPVAAGLGEIDVALVSHDQHPDNLDASGRALLARVPHVLTHVDGAARLGGGARGLAPYESVELGALRVTALPALHGPPGAEALLGPVIGFLLSGDGLPSVYVSGDNASLDVVREIADRVGPVEIALLFAGRASSPKYFDGAPLTLGSAEAAEAARILGARAVVPIHHSGWSHYSQDRASLLRAFADAGIDDVLVAVPDGAQARL
jgi:L-ascorbate metabolism protein UlaG (beta-lactamase superfamily)